MSLEQREKERFRRSDSAIPEPTPKTRIWPAILIVVAIAAVLFALLRWSLHI